MNSGDPDSILAISNCESSLTGPFKAVGKKISCLYSVSYRMIGRLLRKFY